jgi:SAM-dependent methyltransferase
MTGDPDQSTGEGDLDLASAWEGWWAGIDGTPGEIVWDADPGDLEADLKHFADLFGQALPVVDFGCGDGRQTRFLARHFAHVTGVDFAAAAISRARSADNPPNVTFQVLDVGDPVGAARLHQELADANVYIRGMLQALLPGSRPAAVQSIAALLGETGTLFAKELPPEAGSYFADVIQRHGMPPGIAKVMRQIPPGQISEQELASLFPAGRFEVLGTGTSHIHTINTLPGGEVIIVPAVWALIRPRHAG